MSLKHKLQTLLEATLAKGGVSNRGLSLSVETDVGPIVCELTAVDTLACEFFDFMLQTDQLEGSDMEQIKSVSESLSQRLTYLLEPISPIEIDAEGCLVQMRSTPPQRDERGPTYYELTVRRSYLRLCRYHKAKGQARQQIPIQVTREVLARLASDFVAAVQ